MKTITLQKSKRNFFRLMFIFAFMGMSFSTYAATVYLKNGHNGTWETVSNWVTTSGGSTPYGSVPQPGDNVVIPSTVTTTALSVNSTVTINQLDLSKVAMSIQTGSFTVNHATLTVNANIPAVKITGGSITNYATMTVTGNTTAANFTTQTVYSLIDLENNATSGIFENKTGATLTLNNSGFTATTNNTAYTPTFFLINQYTITGKVILNGTVNLTNKTYQVQTASVPGYKQVVFKCGNLSKSTIDGTFTVGTPSAPFVGANLLYCTSATATITFPSTANITFNAEMGSGDTGGQMFNYSGLVSNAGNITFNAPAPRAPYTLGVNQYLSGITGLTNTGTLNFTGKITNKAINISNTGGTTYVFNNSGTINVNSTAGCNAIAAYEGTSAGTYPTSTGTNAIFQLTNSGTINLYSTGTGINIGNNDANSWFKNTSTGIINTNHLIASGYTSSVNDGGTPKNYKESPASTSMKFYNAGIVNFDMELNTTNVTNSVKNADCGIVDTKLNYAIMKFINALDGTGGTVKGRGVFLAGSLDNSIGTLSPGNRTTTMTYKSGNTFTTTQVGTANIGQFDIQGASVALTGNASMDVNGATAATTGYDQIINSTASAVLGVTGVSLSVTNGGGYTPAASTTFDLFKATDATGTRTGNFVGTVLPSANWSVGYATNTANVVYTGGGVTWTTDATQDCNIKTNQDPTSIITYNGSTYYIYVDVNLQMVVAKITGTVIQRCAVFPIETPADDNYHCSPTIGIDKNGYIHICGDMHNAGWKYYRSNNPEDITGWTQRTDLPGIDITYTTFSYDKNREMFLCFRHVSNVSGKGNDRGGVIRYHADTDTFTMLGGTNYVDTSWNPQKTPPAGSKPITMVWGNGNGGNGGWYTKFGHRVFFDNTNRMHLMSALINSNLPSPYGYASNTTIIYAYSDDLGVTWHKAGGASISTLPLTPTNASIVLDRTTQHDIIGGEGELGAFDLNTPVISYQLSSDNSSHSLMWNGSIWKEIYPPHDAQGPQHIFMSRPNGYTAWYNGTYIDFTNDGINWNSLQGTPTGFPGGSVGCNGGMDREYFKATGNFRYHAAFNSYTLSKVITINSSIDAQPMLVTATVTETKNTLINIQNNVFGFYNLYTIQGILIGKFDAVQLNFVSLKQYGLIHGVYLAVPVGQQYPLLRKVFRICI